MEISLPRGRQARKDHRFPVIRKTKCVSGQGVSLTMQCVCSDIGVYSIVSPTLANATEPCSETKSADAECTKLTDEARKSCTAEVVQRRNEVRELADAMYQRLQSDAKALKAP